MNGASQGGSAAAPFAEELAFGSDAPLQSVMQTMRAMRRLKPDPVPEELLVGLCEAASWAPSASNAQAHSYLLVTERDQIARLEPLWRRIFDLYMSTVGRLPSATTAPDKQERMHKAIAYQADHFSQIPALIVVCYSASAQGRRLLSEWRGALSAGRSLSASEATILLRGLKRSSDLANAASVYPAVQNLLLSARALGLGATMTTWHLLLERRFKAVLEIPDAVKTYAIVPVGWPRGNFGPVRRKPIEPTIHWQSW